MERRKRRAADLKAEIEAERAGSPFLVAIAPDGQETIVALSLPRVTVGRDESCDIRLADDEVSRVHALIECFGQEWAVTDDGLSRNGTVVNGEPIARRMRLRDGDAIDLGATRLLFRTGQRSRARTTIVRSHARAAPPLTEAQRRVLVALCRPYAAGGDFSAPAPNQTIADELQLSVSAVKTHLRALFARFGVEALPAHRKRSRLVEAAFETGAVAPRDLVD